MFRKTPWTGNIVIGTMVRSLTAFYDADTNSTEWRMENGSVVPVTKSSQFLTYLRTRKAARTKISKDHRYSTDGPRMFFSTTAQLSDPNGNLYATPLIAEEFILHMLSFSEGTKRHAHNQKVAALLIGNLED